MLDYWFLFNVHIFAVADFRNNQISVEEIRNMVKPLITNRVQQVSDGTASNETLQLSQGYGQVKASTMSATVQAEDLSQLASNQNSFDASVNVKANMKVSQSALPTTLIVQSTNKLQKYSSSLTQTGAQPNLETSKIASTSKKYSLQNAVKFRWIELSHRETGQVLRYFADAAGASSFLGLKSNSSILACLAKNQSISLFGFKWRYSDKNDFYGEFSNIINQIMCM